MANSSISSASKAFNVALAGVQKDIRDRISTSFIEVRQRYLEAEFSDKSYDSIGLSAGKFCEAVLRCLQQRLTGSHIPFGTHLKDFASECRKLEQLQSTTGPESLRVIIPRALLFAYTIRNKRGIGHVGGDVDANRTDMGAIQASVVWIVCELIRVFHGISLEEAQALIDNLNTRRMPLVWEVMGRKRVLRTDLNYRDKALLLLYTAQNDGVLIEELFDWIEYSNLSMFKRSVVGPLHKERLVEFDQETESVFISPLGLRYVESNLLENAAA
jgi:hypothetical protein